MTTTNPPSQATRCAGSPRSRATTMAAGLGVAWMVAMLAGCAQPPLKPSTAGAVAPPPGQPSPALPEGNVARSAQATVLARRHMIAAGHPLATEAGLQMLRAGGSALDAAIAAQMVLTLVEPQSSGIGGGAFLLHWDGRSVQAWDGRETAPAEADERLLLGPDGKPVPFQAVVIGGRAVGVPGTVRMLEAAHRTQGRLPWAQLFEPAIRLSRDGFPVSERLSAQIAADPALARDPLTRAYFLGPDGRAHPPGHRLRNPALAAVLQRLASEGSRALYEGTVASDIVQRVRSHPGNPGRMSTADLAGYTPQTREPMCTLWRQAWRICGFPPPSSGHLAILQMLGILEHVPASREPLQQGLPGPAWLHAYTEAARLAYADRAQFVADPAFVQAPGGSWSAMLDPAYLRQRAALIGATSMKRAQPGQPGAQPLAYAPQTEGVEHGTTHISVVDGEGRAVSMTTTVEAVFGARIMSDGGTGLTGGFILNNELTDFSAAPADAQGKPIANRVQPGKRPRSSMSPTLVFDARDGRLIATLGSPLGQAIPHLVAKTLFAALAWDLQPAEAIALPNMASFNGPTVLETGRYPAATHQALRALGHELTENDLTSGLQLIRRTPQGWAGASDPRREGRVLGD